MHFCFLTIIVIILKLLHLYLKDKILVFILKAVIFCSIEAAGTGMFVFGVFPHLDLVRSILIMNAISFIPATLNLFQSCVNNKLEDAEKTRNLNFVERLVQSKVCRTVLKILTALMQYSVFFIVLFTEFELIQIWQFLVALVLVSIGLSRNFFNYNTIQKG